MGTMDELGQIEILLAEDNPVDAEMTMRALQKHHLANKVHWVRDGAEALAYLFGTGTYANHGNGIPKLILLDIKMPKADGIDVLKRLRADERTRLLPVRGHDFLHAGPRHHRELPARREQLRGEAGAVRRLRRDRQRGRLLLGAG